MLRKSDAWMGAGLLVGFGGVALMFAAPRAALFVMVCLFAAIGCFLMSGRNRVLESERAAQVSNTRPEPEKKEWERYDR